jgi:hypothetical protein
MKWVMRTQASLKFTQVFWDDFFAFSGESMPPIPESTTQLDQCNVENKAKTQQQPAEGKWSADTLRGHTYSGTHGA